jgi:hypothetical protein
MWMLAQIEVMDTVLRPVARPYGDKPNRKTLEALIVAEWL